MNENSRQIVKSSVHETGNTVITSMQNGKNGLWHDACIILMWKMLETAFLALLHMEWCRKRCFCVQTIRSKEGNNVFGLFHEKLLTETM